MFFKKIGVYAAMILVLSLVFVVPGKAASPKYAAKVNGVGIKNITLEATVNNFIENQKLLGIDVKEEDKGGLRKDILEGLISAELLYQESKKADLGDLGEEIKKQFENIKKGFGSDEEFEKVLKDRGINARDLKEDIKKGVYINAFLEKNIYSNITISEAEKREEYERNKDMLGVPEQVRVSHILIRVGGDAGNNDKKDANKRIKALRKSALSGEDFGELARENSEDGSAPRGGDLGYFKKGDMVKPFEDAAFSLEKDEISKVVETQFGYHIIKLLDKQSARTLSYGEVENDIQRFLLNQRKQQEVDKLAEGLRKSAKIEIY